MKKIIIIATITALAITGCSKEPKQTSTGDMEIKIAGKYVTAQVDTKTPYLAANANGMAADVVTSLNSNFSTLYGTVANTALTFHATDAAGTQKGFTTPIYYPVVATTNVYICGFYPQSKWNTLTASTTSTATITGSDDLMFAASQATTKAQATAGTYPSLAFNHLLTLLNISITGDDTTDPNDDPVAAAAAWGTITEITLVEANGALPNTVVTVTKNASAATAAVIGTPSAATGIPTFTTTNFTTGNTNTPFATQTLAIPVALATKTAAAYVIAPPVITTLTTDVAYKLHVKTSKNPVGIDVAIRLSLIHATPGTVGKKIDITLTFKALEINAKATVAVWTDGGSGSGTIE